MSRPSTEFTVNLYSKRRLLLFLAFGFYGSLDRSRTVNNIWYLLVDESHVCATLLGSELGFLLVRANHTAAGGINISENPD
jgi:hypothetical protein